MLQSDKIIPHLQTLFILLGAALLSSSIAIGQDERAIVRAIQTELGGVMEYVNPDKSRVDLLTSKHAIEVDYASKWKESIGQALWYALQTNRKAAIVLIVDGNYDYKYVQKLQSTIDHNGLTQSIDVFVYPNDFLHSNTTEVSTTTASSSSHWLSTNSTARHNRNCRWFRVSRGSSCGPNDGKPAGCCGG